MADEDIVIVFDDAAEGDRGATAKAGGDPAGKTANADDPDLVSDLRSQLSTMRTQNAHLAQAAATAQVTAQQASDRAAKEVHESRGDTIASGIAAEDAKASRAEQAYKTAFEAGDPDAMAKAQREMAGAEARKVRLEEAKARIDEAPARRTPRTEAVTAPSDPLEAWIFNGGSVRSPETSAWARRNRDVVLNPHKLKKLTAAHFDAEAEGIAVDSPEYFRHVEKFVGVTSSGEDDNGRREPVRERRPGATTLPADGGGSAGGGRVEVKLSKGERETATDGTLTWNYDDPSGKFKKGDPIGLQEMARRKIAMQKDGLYDKSFTVS